MSRRTEMLASTIQRELAEFIMRDMNDPRLTTIVSITRVKVTQDLEFADLYVSIMGTPGQQTAALNALKHSAGLMRTRLTKSLSIRRAPFLRIQIDEQIKKELEVLALIEKARHEAEEAERQRLGADLADAIEPSPTAGAAEAPDGAGAGPPAESNDAAAQEAGRPAYVQVQPAMDGPPQTN